MPAFCCAVYYSLTHTMCGFLILVYSPTWHPTTWTFYILPAVPAHTWPPFFHSPMTSPCLCPFSVDRFDTYCALLPCTHMAAVVPPTTSPIAHLHGVPCAVLYDMWHCTSIPRAVTALHIRYHNRAATPLTFYLYLSLFATPARATNLSLDVYAAHTRLRAPLLRVWHFATDCVLRLFSRFALLCGAVSR